MNTGSLGLYAIAGGIVSGIFLRSFFVIEMEVLWFLALLIVGVSMAARMPGTAKPTKGYSSQNPSQDYLQAVRTKPSPLLPGIIFLAGVVLGVVRFDMAEAQLAATAPVTDEQEMQTFIGVVMREPELRATTQHVYLRSGSERLLVITDRYQDITYGDSVTVVGELSTPEAFTTDLGRTFLYPGYLAARGVVRTMIYPSEIEAVSDGEGSRLLAGLFIVKDAFQTSLRQVVPEPQVGLAEGLLLGEKRALGEELTEVFRRSGIIHIVVLSGYNVLLVAGFFLYILSFFFSLRGRVVGGIVAIVLFALLVGLSPTVVRASIMAVLLLLATLLGRQYAIFRALLIAGLIMLLLNPYLLVYDPGFQLSFLATLGLIMVAPMLETMLVRTSQLPSLRLIVVSTTATQLAVLPLLLYQIGEVSIVAVVVNVLVLPMVPVAMLLTFVAGIASFLWQPAGFLFGYMAYWSLEYILVVARFFGEMDYAALAVPVFPFWVVVAGYGLIIYFWWRFWYKATPEETLSWKVENESAVRERSSLTADQKIPY